MVIKTELCHYSEWKIYPGRGQRFIAKDGKSSLFLSRKARVLGLNKIKAQKIKWTTAWRRLNRKTNQDDAGKKKKKRVFKRERAIEGVTLEAIKKLKTARPEDKKALAQEAILEIKDRKKNLIEKKRQEKKGTGKDKAAQQKVQDKVSQKASKKATTKKSKA
jgi:large subunit ribosomal protein L24e